jgi:hypothetical protein
MRAPNSLLTLAWSLAFSACGSSDVAGPSVGSTMRGSSAVTLTAAPEPVKVGADITYRVNSGAGPASDPQVVVHLPPGVVGVQASGASWRCIVAPSGADSYQPSLHADVDCSSAAMGSTPPLTIRARAPSDAGQLRACAVGRGNASACATTTVVP